MRAAVGREQVRVREHVVAQGCRAAFAGADELDEWYGAELLAAGISREARAAVPGAAGGRAWAGGVGLVKAVEVGRGCPHWHLRSAPNAIVRSAPFVRRLLSPPPDSQKFWRVVLAACPPQLVTAPTLGRSVVFLPIFLLSFVGARCPLEVPQLTNLPAARSVFAFTGRRARVARITRMLNDAKANHGALPCASPSHGC